MTDQKKNHLLDTLQKVKEMEEREVWLREELIMVSSTKRSLLVQMEATLQVTQPVKPVLQETGALS